MNDDQNVRKAKQKQKPTTIFVFGISHGTMVVSHGTDQANI